jgi:hypothetical protein
MGRLMGEAGGGLATAGDAKGAEDFDVFVPFGYDVEFGGALFPTDAPPFFLSFSALFASSAVFTSFVFF